MPNKLIIIDNGNVLHKAIFAYLGQYKRLLERIMFPNATKDDLGKQYYTEEHAREILEKQINNREIFLMNPPMTYLRMVIGYLKKLEITLEDRVIIAEDYGSWRKEIDKTYKAQRKEFRETKASEEQWAEMYDEMNQLMKRLDTCVPWNIVKIYKMESDDLASVAVRFLKADEKILISADVDWQQLCLIPNVKIFSPYTKKFKEVKNPEKVLLDKIKGDRSDNLLEEPKTEAEYDKRKMIVDLIHLPQHIESVIRPVIETLPRKNLYLSKVPFASCRKEIKKLYKIEK